MSKVIEGLRQMRDAARAVSNSPGAAPLHAAWRGGLKDLQDAVLPAFPDSQKAREEPGGIASPTPQMVTAQLTGRDIDREIEPDRE
jgi:hypothetical protein